MHHNDRGLWVGVIGAITFGSFIGSPYGASREAPSIPQGEAAHRRGGISEREAEGAGAPLD